MRKSSAVWTKVLFAAVAATAASQVALAEHTTTWTGNANDGGKWSTDANWDDSAPNATARAKIGSNATVHIDITNAQADSIEILSGATLIIDNGKKLTLTDDATTISDSEIVGELKIEKGGTLEVDEDLSIKGNGGKITGLTTGGTATPIIKGSASTDTMTIYGAGSTRATSLLVQGNLDIQAELVNNAFVVANNGTLLLSTNAKSGTSGYWIAEGGAHTLKVNVAVSGGATWQLIDNKDAKIWINAACTSLTGNFEVKKGTLDIDEDLDSTGNLTFESSGVGEHPRIEVKSGKIAEWS